HGFTAVGDHVPAQHAFEPVRRDDVADHDVVAAFHVEVHVARAGDADVVAAVRVVLELVVVVADGDAGGRGGALHPVVAGAADVLTEPGAHVDDVVPRTAEDFRFIVAGKDEVVAFVALQQVERAGTAGDGVVARTALHHVVAERVGQDVVAVAHHVVVVAGAAFHAVVARTAGQRVVTFARHDVVAVDG